MQGAHKVALAASLGSLLQGWDNGALAGALLYLKPEFHLEDKPTVEGMVVAATLFGAVCSTVCAGPGADWLGRKRSLIGAAFIFCLSSLAMVWSPSVYMLIAIRFLIGTAIGLVVTIVPIYIAETAPAEIRGQLATFPQLLGSVGLFVSYVLVFVLSLTLSPSWRGMLGVLLVPSLVYLFLVVFYLPESPRWLVSKGQMLQAKHVLQRLRNREDVSAELALLVEGLEVSADVSFEEWILKPVAEETVESIIRPSKDESQIKLFAPEEGVAWIATPVVEDSPLQRMNRCASVNRKSVPLLDPVVSVIGSLQQAQEHHQAENEHQEEGQDRESFPEPELKEDGDKFWDEEAMIGQFDEANLRAPLLSQSRQNLDEIENAPYVTVRRGSNIGALNGSTVSQHGSMQHGSLPESLGSVGIGGGWQLAWQWVEPEAAGRGDEGGLKRVFLQELVDPNRVISTISLPGVPEEEFIPAAALVSQPQLVKDIDEAPVGPVMVHPSTTALPGPAWSDVLIGGVRRALIVGLGLQFLQQFSGINAVLYFIPQILQQSGLAALLTNAGISSASASILGSAVSSLLMLPCIFLAMRLMDKTGRRTLLLSTLPVLLLALVVVVFSESFLQGLAQAIISFVCVTVYVCAFVTGFGPIPNILCSEIFPTRVRGLCIGMCQATFWTCNIVVTYLFPILLKQMGLGGVFILFAVVCSVAWVFIYLKVPETKGMPLEVISEFFAMSHPDTKKV